MRVAIVHYHLKPGGVTRVIQHAVDSLASVASVETVALIGMEPATPFPGNWRVIPGLQYERFSPAVTATDLADQMVATATKELGAKPDLFHVHNHSLGKSMVLPDALVELAERGFPLLLQIHDFAEDGRPANYRQMIRDIAGGSPHLLPAHLYPQGEHVHYAVINGRDCSFLRDAGVEDNCLHLVPNPVDLPLGDELQDIAVAGQDTFNWVYPTRAIRRKNVGEFLLWAALAPENHHFATTLGPDNPLELPRYKRWKEVALELELPVSFEIGSGPGSDFASLLRQADGLVTTSVTEGFGLAYLEPWLVGRPVTGRILDEITGEFSEAGIVLPWGYQRVDIPVSWFDREQLKRKITHGLQLSMSAYGREPKTGDFERVLSAWVDDETVDFGRLDEELQETVLRRIAENREDGQQIVPCQLPQPVNAAEVIQKNQQVLKQHYCVQEYGRSLARLYHHVADSKITGVKHLDGGVLLDHFLAPERLHLLKVD